MKPVLTESSAGIYCPPGGFYIDPRRRVPTAIVTHAHMDHFRPGGQEDYCSSSSVGLMRLRLRGKPKVTGIEFGRRLEFGEVTVSFHPAGHILGSSQVRVESGGQVWVVSGDYKRGEDPSCEPFEVVPCDTFVTEATFARSAAAWRPGAEVIAEISEWWRENRRAKKVSVLYCYVLGKLQRILAGLSALDAGREVYIHRDAELYNECYRRAGFQLAPTRVVPRKLNGLSLEGALVLAPPKYLQSSWYRRFGDTVTAFASGWMALEDPCKFGYEKGFALSDHADWSELVRTIEETGARSIVTCHGDASELDAYLRSQGYSVSSLPRA
ncbi:MAG: ligase-associated DNA damage response exonuclease [Planctomycetes bacterium]|nr:ligase-associated DNA damage response exonuclease [Planctomycetota bacterium]